MAKFKSYNQFLNESKGVRLMDIILDSLELTIQELINKTEESYIQKYDKTFSEYEREITRLTIIYDMVKSIEKYTLPSDSLISINTSVSRKGNLAISAKIQREESTYYLNTEVIVAGGYNIQIAHYRYITSTDLPQTGNTIITKEYSDRIKKMSKIEKLNAEIESYKKRIKVNNDKVEEASKLTDDEIFAKMKSMNDTYDWPSWDEIVKRGASVNYNNSKAEYEMAIEKSRINKIAFYKTINIEGPSQNTKELQKQITKLENKIKQAIDNN